MLAKAFTKEANIPYFEISGSKLFELDYIKEVYEAASKHTPCAVILEDIDIKGIMQGAKPMSLFLILVKYWNRLMPWSLPSQLLKLLRQ